MRTFHSAENGTPWWSRVIWFSLLWLGGVLAVTLVAAVLKLLIWGVTRR
jgi:hypothetical protein